jgi:biopolymer transport protein ExbB/TolQ
MNPAAVPPHFSFLSLAANADVVVQAVMAALLLASVMCWTIGLEKLIRYSAFSRHVRRLEEWADNSFLERSSSWLVTRLGEIAAAEPLPPGETASGLKANIQGSLHLEIAAQMRRLQSGLPLLATVGSTAPFVGLFGTVWGIMNSFSGIAAAKDTSLAVVAPGIAEALLATAIGLAAAIPAVIIYNLANVYLSDSAERLSHAAARIAKAHCVEAGRSEA